MFKRNCAMWVGFSPGFFLPGKSEDSPCVPQSVSAGSYPVPVKHNLFLSIENPWIWMQSVFFFFFDREKWFAWNYFA